MLNTIGGYKVSMVILSNNTSIDGRTRLGVGISRAAFKSWNSKWRQYRQVEGDKIRQALKYNSMVKEHYSFREPVEIVHTPVELNAIQETLDTIAANAIEADEAKRLRNNERARKRRAAAKAAANEPSS